MKCKECDCCREVPLTRWSSTNKCYTTNYVHECFGVKEPFIIYDIDSECTEHPDHNNKTITIEDAINHFKYGISHDIFSEPVTSYAKMAVDALAKEKHGYWFLLDECVNEGVYCSVCRKKVYKKHYANLKEKSKFCPNCGAIMDGEFVRL